MSLRKAYIHVHIFDSSYAFTHNIYLISICNVIWILLYKLTIVFLGDMMLYLIIIVILVLWLLWIRKYDYRKNKKIGDIGEKIVRNILKTLPKNYKVKNNVHINGYQIDHMVIVGKIIYVIETKMYGGYLRGNAVNRYLNHNGMQRFNPIVQNELHCKAVKCVYYSYTVKSVICFTGKCKIDIKGDFNATVLHSNELYDYLIG